MGIVTSYDRRNGSNGLTMFIHLPRLIREVQSGLQNLLQVFQASQFPWVGHDPLWCGVSDTELLEKQMQIQSATTQPNA